jgi:MerR family transcriptional regulator/heat shock protein HspR
MKEKDELKYKIGEAAELLNISVHTLRMYERAGLIIPYKKETNQRLYSESDIERIRCIRNTINEEKVSIEGIRRILAMIPCWAIIRCSKEDREKCQVIRGFTKPCWTLKHKDNACATRDCRTCVVYNDFADCHIIKNKIYELTQLEI